MIKVLEPIDNINPSEVLEYLDFIGENCYIEAGNAEEDCILYAKDYVGFNTIKQALLELKVISEAKHSEALNITKATEKYTGIDLSIIKQALIKAREQEKVLEIIKLKRVPITVIFEFDTYDDYWEWAYSNVIRLYLLSKEEFDLLKKIFNND